MALNQFMHPRNRYRNNKPDFAKLAQDYPEFKQHLSTTLAGNVSLDFRDPEALRALTCTLLKEDFGIDLEIPMDRIIPTVPLRLNYILWIEDLLKQSGHDRLEEICGIDVGCGTSCIYPLLGAKVNGWHFTASEVDSTSTGYAMLNVNKNKLQDKIQVLEVSPDVMLCGIFKMAPRPLYHFTMCNPPFFGNIMEAQGIMTSRNVSRREPSSVSTAAECEMVWEEGGEVDFISRMITDSLQLREQVVWYTSMIGKKASLGPLKQELAKHKIRNVTTTEFCQGRTMRWGIAWTFHDDIEPLVHMSPVKKFKRDKERPPLVITVPEQYVQNALQQQEVSSGSKVKPGGTKDQQRVKAVAKAVEKLLGNLEIELKSKPGIKLSSRYTLTAVKNTWSNQRRKRRQKLKRRLMLEGATLSEPADRNPGMGEKMTPSILTSDKSKSVMANSVLLQRTKPLSEECGLTHTIGEVETNNGPEHSPRKESCEMPGIAASCSETILSETDVRTLEVKQVAGGGCQETAKLLDKKDSLSHSVTNESNATNVTLKSVDTLQGVKPVPVTGSSNLDISSPGGENAKGTVALLSSSEGSSQEAGFVFKCLLSIRLADGSVVVEMSWTEGKTRESMHQVGQYMKNQFNKI
ncbi:RNA N6-adenosine-methyltransferase mettl16-like [Asterias rubens]|uniref:RNA N6-adenosine-methyltransferase mettl16-like n=1 Tax=Asterias rubens TaxID=7604 RepID=UPI001454F548|nr:RNA N6-adenosine-methyltransferase mettl16-like [Asterias rubens]XP_033626956.1 RNA N6-adenosine-methyltransferase mettl16-like [Asterias rubens]XP_033626957.1 RNA N6-adenosine-methyltransferase mettl16-like [Asterias rubens]